MFENPPDGGSFIDLKIETHQSENGPRYHLLTAASDKLNAFEELVASTGDVTADGDWLATVESPFDVSSVEADARMARFTRKHQCLGLRMTRMDDLRWWLAVHHKGKRLFAMVHQFGPMIQSIAAMHMGTDADVGRDPLLDLLKDGNMTLDEAKRKVADERGSQLHSALIEGNIQLDPAQLIEGLANSNENDTGLETLAGLLNILKIRRLITDTNHKANDMIPTTVKRMIGKAVVMGCVMPILAGGVTFWLVTRLAVRSGISPGIALLLAFGCAWMTIRSLRVIGTRVRPEKKWAKRLTLAWAADGDAPQTPVRPTADALNTWGGFFYLLRDIAFFAGIDRPNGAFAMYIEAWAIGPPALVHAMNRVCAGEVEANRLIEAAQALVDLRDQLIDDHLENRKSNRNTVIDRVRTILKPTFSA